MPFVRRIVALIWGDQLDPELRPLVVQGLTSSLAASAGWSFVGIWALKRLHAGQTGIGLAFLVGALLGAVVGYAAGHVSDYVGRRPLMLVGSGGFCLLSAGFVLVGDRELAGLALISLAPVLGGIASSSAQALIADLIPRERHETGFASMRVAWNLGTTLGPPVGGLLLALGGWNALFGGVAVLMAVAFVVSLFLIPRRGEHGAEGPPERGSFAVIRRDRPFLLFLVSGCLAYLVYVSYETVLPISLVGSHGFAPATWGFLLILNPLSVTLFQLRLTRHVTAVDPAAKLVVAMLLMGFPFLLLAVSAAVPVVVCVLLLFVLGEMLWVPTSQAIVAALAPVDLRGAYMGAFGATSAFGFAIAPLFGLQVRAALGDAAMWAGFAAVSVIAAATGAVAVRRSGAEPAAVAVD
jgi:predicted MFS family arabinose efflux permease